MPPALSGEQIEELKAFPAPTDEFIIAQHEACVRVRHRISQGSVAYALRQG